MYKNCVVDSLNEMESSNQLKYKLPLLLNTKLS